MSTNHWISWGDAKCGVCAFPLDANNFTSYCSRHVAHGTVADGDDKSEQGSYGKPTSKEVDDAFTAWEIAVYEGFPDEQVEANAARFDALAAEYLGDVTEVLKFLGAELARNRKINRALKKRLLKIGTR